MPVKVPKPSEIQAHANRVVHVYGGVFLSEVNGGNSHYYTHRPATIIEQVGPHSYIVNIQFLNRDEEASVILTGEKGNVIGQTTVELYVKLLFVERMDLFESLQPAAPASSIAAMASVMADEATANDDEPEELEERVARVGRPPNIKFDDADDTDKARLETGQPIPMNQDDADELRDRIAAQERAHEEDGN